MCNAGGFCFFFLKLQGFCLLLCLAYPGFLMPPFFCLHFCPSKPQRLHGPYKRQCAGSRAHAGPQRICHRMSVHWVTYTRWTSAGASPLQTSMRWAAYTRWTSVAQCAELRTHAGPQWLHRPHGCQCAGPRTHANAALVAVDVNHKLATGRKNSPHYHPFAKLTS
jgi:hypothetical protein